MRSLNPWPIFPANLDPPVARSLSLQFILQELIRSYKLLHHLQILTPQQIVGNELAEELAAIAKELEKFLLFSLESPFSQKGGVLDKLCFYSEILLQASKIKETDISMILEGMRNGVLKTKARLLAWKKMAAPDSIDQILCELFELYADLRLNLSRFFSALSDFLQEARSDENVLVYLIAHKTDFNAYLGPRAIEDLLRRFFPVGQAQLRAVICEGYTRRGFTASFLEAEPLIEAIEWETPCLFPSPAQSP